MFTRFRRPIMRRSGPVVATCLLVLGAITGPVAHALAEVPDASVTAEASHSPQCDRLHSEQGCPAATLGTVPGDGPIVLAVPVRRVIDACAASTDLAASCQALSTRFVRGPPAA